jgi:hypothetical protein
VNPRRLLALPIAAIALLPGPAGAVELALPGKDRTVRLGLTQTLIGEYHADVDVVDGNESPAYFDVKNRTGIVLQHGTTSFSLRFDAHGFAGAEDNEVKGFSYEDRASLEKISLSTTQRAFELTMGDFGVRVGRGLALDLTKVDELYRDTTLRGTQARLTTRFVNAQLFGGWVNPLAIDDFEEAPVQIPDDVIGGGRLEVRPHRIVALGLHYVGGGLESRLHKTRNATHTIGGSVELPSPVGWLSLYGEFNFMRQARDVDVLTGTGTYFNATANLGPVAVLLEFKFYQHLQFVNVFGDNEWDTQIYHRPPTLMWSKQEVINNHDVIGPRARLDYSVGKLGTTLWASYGHFFRSDASPDVAFFDSGVNVDDVFGGVQQALRGGALDVTGGYRQDRRSQDDGEAVTDYSQAFAEVELSLAVWRGHSVELETLYRKVEKSAEEFSEFHISVGYRPRWWIAGSVTYEYSDEITDTNPADAITVRNHFGGVTGTVNFTPASYARVFAGTTRGGVRCIDGFCRQIPPFMGLKIETVLQF